MTMLAGEGLAVGFEAPLEVEVEAGDLVLVALQEQLAEGERLRHYEPLWRKDYEGDASAKKYVGGALLLEFTVFADEQFSRRQITVADGMFPAEVKERLEAGARANWGMGRGWVRDYGRK